MVRDRLRPRMRHIIHSSTSKKMPLGSLEIGAKRDERLI